MVDVILGMLRVDASTGEKMPRSQAIECAFSPEQILQLRTYVAFEIDEPENGQPSLSFKVWSVLLLRLAVAFEDEHAKVARVRRALER